VHKREHISITTSRSSRQNPNYPHKPIFTFIEREIKKKKRENQMEERKIVVVVEEAEAARTALKWALHNILRYGDVLTLLHVFPYFSPKSRSKKKLRLLRLKGYQLALSFQDICTSSSFNVSLKFQFHRISTIHDLSCVRPSHL